MNRVTAEWAVKDVLAYATASVRETIKRLVDQRGMVKIGQALAEVQRARELSAEQAAINRNAEKRRKFFEELDDLRERAPRVLGGSSDARLLWWFRETAPLLKRASRAETSWAARRRREGRGGRPALGATRGYDRLVRSFRALGAKKREAEQIVFTVRARPILPS